jgi:hypothetical protein
MLTKTTTNPNILVRFSLTSAFITFFFIRSLSLGIHSLLTYIMKGFIGKAHRLFNADLAAPPQPPSEKRKSRPISGSKTSSVLAPPSIVGFSGISSCSDLLPAIQDPSALDILRYRYHHATNLGSVYVLERWLSPSRFPHETSGSSELEAVKSWVAKLGAEQTKQMFETAWANAVTDEYEAQENVFLRDI